MLLERERTSSPAVASRVWRGYIQGRRALAVTVVILKHLHILPTGGFDGVVIFFVLFGYLISELLLREHPRPA